MNVESILSMTIIRVHPIPLGRLGHYIYHKFTQPSISVGGQHDY